MSRGPANRSVAHRPSTSGVPQVLSEIAQRPAETVRRTGRCRCLGGAAVVAFIVVPLPVLRRGTDAVRFLRTVAECASPQAGTIPVSPRKHGGDPPSVEVETTTTCA
jgi:hypothetical protein